MKWLPLLLVAACAHAATPNILFILADDMGRGDVSAYNAASAWKTPGIDRLARDGMMFWDAHSASAVCTPSRYTILTGRYNWRSSRKQGVGGGFSKALIEPGRLTMPEMLREHGYATAMLGKWHLGLNFAMASDGGQGRPGQRPGLQTDDPEDGERAGGASLPGMDYSKPFGGGPIAIGFDHFLGISASLDMPPYVWLRDDRAESPPTHQAKASKLPAMWRAGPEADDFAHIDVLPRLRDEAIRYLGRQDGKKPFFLYLALTAPHTPIIPAKGFQGLSRTTPYGDFCVQVDEAVGAVLDALSKDGLADNTLVVFTADNGCSPSANFLELNRFHHDPQMGLRGEKADIYEGGHRIPLIVRWPGKVATARRSDEVVCQGDFMATFADIISAHLPTNAAEDSVSLLRLLTDDQFHGPVREALVSHSINGSFAIRQGDWKLCLCPDSGGWSDPKPGKAPPGSPPFQLFNLHDDPAETTNVMVQHPDVVRRLGRLLRSYIVNGRSTPGAPQPNDPVKAWPQVAWMNHFTK